MATVAVKKQSNRAEQRKYSKYKGKGVLSKYSEALNKLIFTEELNLPNRIKGFLIMPDTMPKRMAQAFFILVMKK